MAGFSRNSPVVLVVHCVDTEGPIGGDVRRNADGTKEFMDNWYDIKQSLAAITSEDFRNQNCDSFGRQFNLNWFIMDFMGFKTNPKNRIQQYNDTYDNIKSLNTQVDAFHWHYHQPPSSGEGDQWSDDWDSSTQHMDILGHRIIHRSDFPEAFRAGGTIEDNKCSAWLEDNLMLDYSNRVSTQSAPTSNIFDFNWFGAPSHWGFYHPHIDNFTRPGNMRRFIVRCVDAKSRLHALQRWEVADAFGYAKIHQRPVILSYFSHDHRDMREETLAAIQLMKSCSTDYDVPFRWCDAKEAVQVSANLVPRQVRIGFERQDERMMIHFHIDIFQKNPFVYTLNNKNQIHYHRLEVEHFANCPYYLKRCFLDLDPSFVKLGVACTSMSGDKSVKVIDL